MILKSILVVEDDPNILENLTQVFEMENFPVHSATNGKEALETLEALEKLPGLICLDMMMPIMDGQRFLSEIESNHQYSRFKDIPVLIVSAARETAKGKTVGHIRKPPNVDELLQFAERYCNSP